MNNKEYKKQLESYRDEASDKHEAEERAIEAMANGECANTDSIYSNCEIQELK